MSPPMPVVVLPLQPCPNGLCLSLHSPAYTFQIHIMLSGEFVAQLAVEVGFDFCAVAPVMHPADETYLRARIAAGHLANMNWFERSLAKRLNIRQWMPEAQSVITAGLSYFVEHPPKEVWDCPWRGRIARYAWGPDYHRTIMAALARLAERLRTVLGTPVRWRACVDSSPVLERSYAVASHLGFVTRNTMFVHPKFGAYVLLGELLTAARLEPWGPFSSTDADPCGSCNACQQICPTGALVADYTLDARRCIAYHTVENRQAIPTEIRENVRRWLFGCDECLQICPFTIRLSEPGRLGLWRFDPDRCAPSLGDALHWTEQEFLERYAGTPVERIGWRRFVRNALVAAGHTRIPDLKDLVVRYAQSDDPLLREHAAWALGQIVRAPQNSG